MKTKYVSPARFERIQKGKVVKNYPNPWIKDIGDVRYHIIDPDMEYEIKLLEESQYLWYLGMTYEDYAKVVKEVFDEDDARVYVLRCDWFPTELVAGIKNGLFSNHAPLSQKSGWIRTFGNIELFRAGAVRTGIEILNRAGFKFDINKIQ